VAWDAAWMSTTKIGDLENQIEQLVREHLSAVRAAAAVALERAFGASGAGRRSARPASGPKRASGRRRPAEEVAALGERLYAAVVANPGAAMSTLASRVGVSTRELNRPAMQLRRAGRVRSVGQRAATRYFPMPSKASTKS
jgi:hypothetical protein